MTSESTNRCRLVFLNGWAASSAMIGGLKSQLPATYELTVLDNLYQFELEDIVAKIDEQMTENSLLVGWSLGGMLALYYASLSSAEHQAKALVLLNSSACFLERSDYEQGIKREEFDGLKNVIQEQNTTALVRLFTHLLVDGSRTNKEDRRLLRPIFNTQTLPSWAALTKGLGYLETLDLRSLLKSIQQPILCVLGEKDALVSASLGAELLEQNTEISVNIIAEMGHFPFGMFAQEVTDIILAYVSPLNITKRNIIKNSVKSS